jgi:hypothetical protein
VSDSILIEVVLKANVLAVPSDEEIELLASVLPDLLVLMQRFDGAED